MQEIKKIYHQLNEESKAAEKDFEKFKTRQSDQREKMNALGAQLAEAEKEQAETVKRFLAEGAKENEVFKGQEVIDKLTSQMRSLEQISAAMATQITELQAKRDELNRQLVGVRYKFFDKISKEEFGKIAEGLARSYAAHRKAGNGGMEFGSYVRESTQDHRHYFRDEALRSLVDIIRADYKM